MLLAAAMEKLRALAADRVAPVLLVAPRVIAVPIVGDLDDEHARHVTDNLLRAIRRERPLAAVLDLSAAGGFDTALAARLLKAVQAARLLGTRVMITGLSGDAAQALVNVGVDFREIETLAALADAVAAVTSSHAARKLGRAGARTNGRRA